MALVLVTKLIRKEYAVPIKKNKHSHRQHNSHRLHHHHSLLCANPQVLLDRTHFNAHAETPVVLFYTGNEGDIAWFADNAGFLRDQAAPDLNALLVYAEHRYFGESMPFGEQSFDLQNVGFLSVAQALADYALIVQELKRELNLQNAVFIAVGGSYGMR